MAKRGRGPFPIPDGYVQIFEAVTSFIGEPVVGPGVSKEAFDAYGQKVRSLWTDVFADLLTGKITCHGVIPGVNFGPLPLAFWTFVQTEGPPGVVPFLGTKVEPLMRADEVSEIAALWARNPYNESRIESASNPNAGVEVPAKGEVATPIEPVHTTGDHAEDGQFGRSTPILQKPTITAAGKAGRSTPRSDYAEELINRTFGSGWPSPGAYRPGVVVSMVLSKKLVGDNQVLPSRKTILKRLGWQ